MSNTVDRNVNAANNLDLKIRQELLGTSALSDNERFSDIDTVYPEIIKDDEVIASKEDNAAQHQKFIDNISKLQLTNSLFLGLGIAPPESKALSLIAAQEIVAAQNGAIEVIENPETGNTNFIVRHRAAEYNFEDTDLWLGHLRAIHFLATRHDPDLTEIINRQLAAAAELNDAKWLETAHAPKAK